MLATHERVAMVRVALGGPKETSVARRTRTAAATHKPQSFSTSMVLLFLHVCSHPNCHESYATVVAFFRALRCLNIVLAFLRARNLALHLWILYDVRGRGSILARTSMKRAEYLPDDARHSKSQSVHGANLVGHLHAIVPGCV